MQEDLKGNLKISGSTALQPLVTTAAKVFMQLHPQTHLTVNGGGSVNGLKDVTSKRSDIGDSDIYADPALYPDPNLTDHIVCVIPFAMITNLDVNISSLTQDQIIKIFSTGEINNWKQVGGPDLKIVPVVRPKTSGTRDTFRKYILGGLDENGTLLPTDSSTTVRERVATTPGAIGYLALSVLDQSVHAININNQASTQENIAAGRYVYWGYEHMYTLGDDNQLTTAFLDFMLTQTVQQQAKKQSYIPIDAMNLPKVDTQGEGGSISPRLFSHSQGSEDIQRESY
ncbi:MAG: phosphate ABC transporter substrate-binding protein [Ktedonobacteraceae bacterium]